MKAWPELGGEIVRTDSEHPFRGVLLRRTANRVGAWRGLRSQGRTVSGRGRYAACLLMGLTPESGKITARGGPLGQPGERGPGRTAGRGPLVTTERTVPESDGR